MLQLQAEERSVLGKQSKRLLHQGKVPAVIYGNKFCSIPLTLDSKAVAKAVEREGHTSIIEVLITSADNTTKKENVLLWNVKRDPVDNVIRHIDLYRVNEKEKVNVRIPLVFTGIAKGMRLGGKLEIYREYMDIIAYPQDLISEIVVDITELGANETIRIEDIHVPSNITKIYDSNIAVLSIVLNTASEDKQK